MKYIRAIGIFALLTGGLATACEVSQDQEVAIGEQTAREVESKLPIVHDPAIEGYVNHLGKSIAAHTERSDLEWHFFVVNSEVVNAFALPGGYIYVNRGLIQHADRLDELAGALGHEIGHVVRRHGAERIKQGERTNAVIMLACTLTNLCGNLAGQVAIKVGGAAYMAKHSRQDESEADQQAVRNVVLARIDPEGIPALFRELLNERQHRPGAVEGWFTTHPLEESRITSTQQMISTLDSSLTQGLTRDTPEYQEFRRAVLSLPTPPDESPATQ